MFTAYPQLQRWLLPKQVDGIGETRMTDQLRPAVTDAFVLSSHLPMRTVNLASSIATIMGDLPPFLAEYPSMMSIDEKRLLYSLAKSRFTGEGRIVDAGIFLGASSNCFAKGLLDNPGVADLSSRADGKPIVSFDMAVVNPGMPSFFTRHNLSIEASIGESFAAFLQDAVKPYENLVDLRIGDITHTIADLGGPIEIAFIDVLKLPSVADAVISKIFPLLIPRKSIVIQQDYFNEHLEFIKTQQEAFGDYFTYLGEIGCSAIFQCKRRITEKIAAQILQGISEADQERFASVAMHRSIDPARRYLMAVSKARLINRLKGGQAALDYLAYVKGDYPVSVLGNGRMKRLDKVMQEVEDLCARNHDSRNGREVS